MVSLSCILFGGCALSYFLGDPLLYGIKGTIHKQGSIEAVSSVKVKLICVKGELRGPTDTYSDNLGGFLLKGRGVPLDCEITLEHPRFKRKIIKLNPEEQLEPRDGFGWAWELRIELEPKSEER